MSNFYTYFFATVLGCLFLTQPSYATPSLAEPKMHENLILNKKSFNKDSLNVTTILSDEKGNSFIRLDRFPLNPQSKIASENLGRVSEPFPIGKMVYRESKMNNGVQDWHTVPVPHGRLIIYITGKYKITVGSPEHPQTHIFTGGDILYFNDQTGHGHITQVLEEGVALMYDFSKPITINK